MNTREQVFRVAFALKGWDMLACEWEPPVNEPDSKSYSGGWSVTVMPKSEYGTVLGGEIPVFGRNSREILAEIDTFPDLTKTNVV